MIFAWSSDFAALPQLQRPIGDSEHRGRRSEVALAPFERHLHGRIPCPFLDVTQAHPTLDRLGHGRPKPLPNI